jgi:hypothetical protein
MYETYLPNQANLIGKFLNGHNIAENVLKIRRAEKCDTKKDKFFEAVLYLNDFFPQLQTKEVQFAERRK